MVIAFDRCHTMGILVTVVNHFEDFLSEACQNVELRNAKE